MLENCIFLLENCSFQSCKFKTIAAAGIWARMEILRRLRGMALDRYAVQEVVILSKLATHKAYQTWHQHNGAAGFFVWYYF
ncbi:hypothetical protein RHGRI_017570 [Rhododendron griersonianum]|uniref:Ribosomal protein S3 n=1 Tax=Rhododendron griersonianum TaxID=479676 RepID=A0AAV6JYB7_9ERIC|nr:hypothetical protein RHGRI_017570 [Rhododendron griersonianum]